MKLRKCKRCGIPLVRNPATGRLGDPEKEWVLDCGLEGCCMPGYHFRYECHTPEMIEAYEEECTA